MSATIKIPTGGIDSNFAGASVFISCTGRRLVLSLSERIKKRIRCFERRPLVGKLSSLDELFVRREGKTIIQQRR